MEIDTPNPSPRHPPQFARKLAGRAVVAGPLLAVVVAAIWASPLALTAIVAIMAGLGALELLENTTGRQHQDTGTWVLTTGAGLLLSAGLPAVAYFYPPVYWLLSLALLSGLALLWSYARRGVWKQVVPSGWQLTTTVFIAAWYTGGALAAFIPIRLSSHGVALILVILSLNVASDTFGYGAGKLWARFADWRWGAQRTKHLPCPITSPGKTYAGFIGGAVGTLAVGSALGYWGHNSGYLILALVIAVSAPLGDLFASWLKRQMGPSGIKDWSHRLGRHGGVLDRLDSLIFTAIASYFALPVMGWL